MLSTVSVNRGAQPLLLAHVPGHPELRADHFVVYVLLQTFYQRNLKPAFRVGMTLIALARELFAAWVSTGRILPWLEPVPPDTS